MAKDLWQTHYQILLKILLKEFINLNVNMDIMIEKMKCLELNTKIVSAVEYTNVKDDLIEYKRLFWRKNYQKRVWWKLK